VEADVLTLHAQEEPDWRPTSSAVDDPWAGVSTVLEAPPAVDVILRAEDAHYLLKQSSLVVREVRGDRVIALIEIVSHGNKSTEFAVERFVHEVATAMMNGIHVAVIDLQKPGKWNPRGMHDVIWRAIGEDGFEPPPEKPFTLASYTGSPDLTCYVKSATIGDCLFPLPLFLDAEHYVHLPLEETYLANYAGVPAKWRAKIEGR
jgi:hypothetical protein